MRFLSLNCEGEKHLNKVSELLASEQPACICLQECPQRLRDALAAANYYTSFVPLTLRDNDTYQSEEGLLLATSLPHTASVHYYHGEHDSLRVFDKENYDRTMKKALLHATVDHIHVATTHFTWTPDGTQPSAQQYRDMQAMMTYTDTLPPHILCGDLNIPRGFNDLYDTYLTPRYSDAIPLTYNSSLDPHLHRYAHTPGKEQLFTDYMVDHLLVQQPLSARDVRLVFGVSDHAAIVGNVYHTSTQSMCHT